MWGAEGQAWGRKKERVRTSSKNKLRSGMSAGGTVSEEKEDGKVRYGKGR